MLRREKNLCCHFARLANMRLEAYRMKFQSALVSNRHCECLITLVSYHSGGQGNSVGAELPAALETTRATKIHSCLAAHFRGRETTLECFRQIVFLPQTEACSFFSIDLLCVFTVRRISRLLCVFTVHSTVRLIIARLIIVRPLPHIIRHSEEVGIIIVLLAPFAHQSSHQPRHILHPCVTQMQRMQGPALSEPAHLCHVLATIKKQRRQ